jgi:hypothetical protein
MEEALTRGEILSVECIDIYTYRCYILLNGWRNKTKRGLMNDESP